MARLTKNMKEALSKYDTEKYYDLGEAAKIVKDVTFTKFDASVDMSVRLGVDPKKSEPNG